MEWYILIRDGIYMIVSTSKGNDPLYGYGSWSLHGGPYKTREQAEQACPQDVEVDYGIGKN